MLQSTTTSFAQRNSKTPFFLLLASLMLAALSHAPATAADSDYPDEARKQKLEGRVGFRAWVTQDGRAKKCEVTASSGHEILDTATCTKIIDKARFDPAVDANGRKTDGWFESTIVWKLD